MCPLWSILATFNWPEILLWECVLSPSLPFWFLILNLYYHHSLRTGLPNSRLFHSNVIKKIFPAGLPFIMPNSDSLFLEEISSMAPCCPISRNEFINLVLNNYRPPYGVVTKIKCDNIWGKDVKTIKHSNDKLLLVLLNTLHLGQFYSLNSPLSLTSCHPCSYNALLISNSKIL